jgi:hypothetical protein
MANPGRPISHEFRTSKSPEETTHEIALRGEAFNQLGYVVEAHGPRSVTLSSRFTPNIAWGIPVLVGVAALLLGVVSPGATTETASTAGTVAVAAFAVAFVLGLIVKVTERVTFNASPDGSSGSRVLVTGTVTDKLREYIEDSMSGQAVEGLSATK